MSGEGIARSMELTSDNHSSTTRRQDDTSTAAAAESGFKSSDGEVTTSQYKKSYRSHSRSRSPPRGMDRIDPRSSRMSQPPPSSSSRNRRRSYSNSRSRSRHRSRSRSRGSKRSPPHRREEYNYRRRSRSGSYHDDTYGRGRYPHGSSRRRSWSRSRSRSPYERGVSSKQVSSIDRCTFHDSFYFKQHGKHVPIVSNVFHHSYVCSLYDSHHFDERDVPGVAIDMDLIHHMRGVVLNLGISTAMIPTDLHIPCRQLLAFLPSVNVNVDVAMRHLLVSHFLYEISRVMSVFQI